MTDHPASHPLSLPYAPLADGQTQTRQSALGMMTSTFQIAAYASGIGPRMESGERDHSDTRD